MSKGIMQPGHAPDPTDEREKHVMIHDAIENMDGISEHLDRLIARLEGDDLPDTSEEAVGARDKRAFMDVLICAPGAIQEKTQNAHQRIERIVELLF